MYTPKKSVQVDFLWGKNDAETAIEHEYIKFYTSPQKFIPPKQISGYAPGAANMRFVNTATQHWTLAGLNWCMGVSALNHSR